MGRHAVYLKPRCSEPNFRHYRFLCIASDAEKAPTFTVSKTVLIADDSASMRLSVRLLLEGRHTELVVREAIDGVDAIEKAKKSRPDLILLDLAMPRLNGAEAATILKEHMPETPVILFTMYTDLVADSLCAAMGVDFISKTDGVSKLLERVDALLPPDTASQTWRV
jgi:CheY-like chemotaxis protein